MEEDLEMRQAALDSVRMAAEELLKQAGAENDDAVKGQMKWLLTYLFLEVVTYILKWLLVYRLSSGQ